MDLQAVIAELKRSTDTFGPFIRAQAERIPDRVALRFEDDTVTYGAYDRAVNRMAACLGREGVARGTPVAILAPNSPLFLVALGAVAKLGAIGALINTQVTGAGLTHVLGASGAAIGVDGLLLRAESVERSLVDPKIFFPENLLHERRESLVEPDVTPVPGREQIAVPLMAELVSHQANGVRLRF